MHDKIGPEGYKSGCDKGDNFLIWSTRSCRSTRAEASKNRTPPLLRRDMVGAKTASRAFPSLGRFQLQSMHSICRGGCILSAVQQRMRE